MTSSQPTDVNPTAAANDAAAGRPHPNGQDQRRGDTPLNRLDRRIVLLSNRGPVSFRRDGDQRIASRGSGGLVTALTGLVAQVPGVVWVCDAATDEDRAVMAENAGRAVQLEFTPDLHLGDPAHEPSGPAVRLDMVDVDPVRHEEFYSVISNPLLWFVQHGLYGLAEEPQLTAGDRVAFEHGYVAVNRQFAQAVITQARAVGGEGGRALVMLHDYHFYLVADQVRRACADALITHFIHIPWPGPNEWQILPPAMRDPLLTGLLGSDVVTFHTRRFARNFLLCAQETLDLPIDLRRMTVQIDGREVQARYHPISIDVPSFEALARNPNVLRHKEELTAEYLTGDHRMILRVDRTDPSKNIVRGFRAFDVMLGDHPELVGRVVFWAMLQPSRQDVPEYANYLTAIGGIVAEINARYAREGWQPVVLRLESDMTLAAAAYSVCDVLLVNAVRDGMNLVAKEAVVVNERDMVLALSETTGAHEELGDYAVTVHPFDIQQQADALYEALTMDTERRRALLEAAREVVRHHDVERWITAQVRDVLRLDAA